MGCTLRAPRTAPASDAGATQGDPLGTAAAVITDVQGCGAGSQCRGLERNTDATARACYQRSSAGMGLREVSCIRSCNPNADDAQGGRAHVCQSHCLRRTCRVDHDRTEAQAKG